ncbi:MAG: phage replisome organizer N-terminal domain-containing protein [Bacteroidales bacterium]|nr:phage replisome organizer N-terminal domain-containing protein [Bacteroidales bacterium]
MSEVKWIKLSLNLFDNRKIKYIRKLPEGNNIILIWIALLTMAGKCNAGGEIFLLEDIPYTPKMLANELDFKENTVKLALSTLERFGMLTIDGDKIVINDWENHQNVEGLDKIREQNRKRVAKHREGKKVSVSNVTSNVTVTQGNATELDIELDTGLEEELRVESKDIIQDVKEDKKEIPKKKEKKSCEGVWLALDEAKLPSTVDSAMREWLNYKDDKNQPYTEQGFKNQLSILKKYLTEFGNETVILVIQDSISRNYEGICFNKCKGFAELNAPKTAKPNFNQNSFNYLMANRLAKSVEENVPGMSVNEETKQAWAADFNAIQNQDGFDPDDIEDTLKYAVLNDFWKTKILNGRDFRNKFTRLYMENTKGERR